MQKLQRVFIISLILVLGLVACGTSDPAPTEVVEPEVEVQESPTEAPVEEDVQSDPQEQPEMEEPAQTSGIAVFKLDDTQSEARFIIDEVLRGNPTTVVGATNQVSGEITIDLDNKSETTVGPISIEAGTLRTDNNFRNGAIRDFILQTGSYPQITFQPKSIDMIPSDIEVGDTFSFEMTGDLTIREITQEVVFTVEVTIESATSLVGSASATILRDDFNLTIPSVQQVASVEPDVLLQLDFTASP